MKNNDTVKPLEIVQNNLGTMKFVFNVEKIGVWELETLSETSKILKHPFLSDKVYVFSSETSGDKSVFSHYGHKLNSKAIKLSPSSSFGGTTLNLTLRDEFGNRIFEDRCNKLRMEPNDFINFKTNSIKSGNHSLVCGIFLSGTVSKKHKIQLYTTDIEGNILRFSPFFVYIEAGDLHPEKVSMDLEEHEMAYVDIYLDPRDRYGNKYKKLMSKKISIEETCDASNFTEKTPILNFREVGGYKVRHFLQFPAISCRVRLINLIIADKENGEDIVSKRWQLGKENFAKAYFYRTFIEASLKEELLLVRKSIVLETEIDEETLVEFFIFKKDELSHRKSIAESLGVDWSN
ncbi:hypothetical protein MHBO_003235 [Bonamia ostreae]|uniref:ApeA N-terminal domain-containing protein n=1 Tax=Bonamia ostreae TaxID=126728 RepID=A0ABV2APV2_9EUKA